MAKSKLTPADKKFIEEFLNPTILPLDVKLLRENVFSKEIVSVTTEVASAIDFVRALEPILYDANALKQVHAKLTPKNSVSKFDRARYIVLKLDQNAYSTLLD